MTTRGGAGGGEVEVGALLKEAWRAYSHNASAFSGGLILSLLVVLPVAALAFGALYLQETGGLDPALGLALEWALGAAAAGVFQWVYAGLLRMSLTAIRGGAVEAVDIFGGGLVFVPVLVTGILIQGLTFAGALLCLIPGLLWYLSSLLGPFFVIDHGLPALAAIRASFAATSGLRLQVFFVSLISGILVVAGMFAACIGLLVAVPLTTLLAAALYERLWAAARPNA